MGITKACPVWEYRTENRESYRARPDQTLEKKPLDTVIVEDKHTGAALAAIEI